MQQHNLQALMRLEWVLVIEDDPDGGVVLTVEGLDDFNVFGTDEVEVLSEFREAFRSHLRGYIATGKVVPVPEAVGKMVDPPLETRGVRDWDSLAFDAETGRTQRKRSSHAA